MNQILRYLVVIILISFALLLVLGSLVFFLAAATTGVTDAIIGGVMMLIAVGLFGGAFLFMKMSKPAEQHIHHHTNVEQNIKVDLPTGVKVEQLKCKECGGDIDGSSVKMAGGVVVINCPWCNESYTLQQDVKW